MMWLLVVLTCLTVYRVTRLLVKDKITDAWRIRLWTYLVFRSKAHRWAKESQENRVVVLRNMRDGEEPLLAYLITCPWCVSVYVGFVIVGVEMLLVDVPYPWLVWGASSAITGLLSAREDG